MRSTNPEVDEHLLGAEKWQKVLQKLRVSLLECALTEEWKWDRPCYSFQDSNVVILLSLKKSGALLFCKGSLLKDVKGILIQPTENTQASGQLRLTSIREIVELEPVIKAYLREAIEAEKAGMAVVYKTTSEYKVTEEFKQALAQNPALKNAFNILTPGRQRGYLLHFAAPKQSKTRMARVVKCRPQILSGRGLHE